jgi:hypothetical protein
MSAFRPLLLVLAAAALSPLAAHAQVLGGRVVSVETDAPIAGVAITVLDTNDVTRGRAVTDSAGAFRVPLIAAGRYRLHAQVLGYVIYLTGEIGVAANEMVVVELRLGEAAVPLEPLIVTARAPYIRDRLDEFRVRMQRQQRMGQGRFITASDIAREPAASFHDLVTRDASISVRRERRPLGHETLVMRGGRRGECIPTLFLDGRRVGRSTEVDLNVFAAPEHIAGIEIYRSAADTPVELRSALDVASGLDPCGVIGVWTRRDAAGGPVTVRRALLGAGIVALILLLF